MQLSRPQWAALFQLVCQLSPSIHLQWAHALCLMYRLPQMRVNTMMAPRDVMMMCRLLCHHKIMEWRGWRMRRFSDWCRTTNLLWFSPHWQQAARAYHQTKEGFNAQILAWHPLISIITKNEHRRERTNMFRRSSAKEQSRGRGRIVTNIMLALLTIPSIQTWLDMILFPSILTKCLVWAIPDSVKSWYAMELMRRYCWRWGIFHLSGSLSTDLLTLHFLIHHPDFQQPVNHH